MLCHEIFLVLLHIKPAAILRGTDSRVFWALQHITTSKHSKTLCNLRNETAVPTSLIDYTTCALFPPLSSIVPKYILKTNTRRTGAGAVPGAAGGVTPGDGAGVMMMGVGGGGGGGGGRPDASSAMGGAGGGAGRGGMGGGGMANECLVYVNTLEACSSFAVRLREMLERDASAAFGGGAGGGGVGVAGHDAERVMSCLQGLGSTRALFSRAASDCLEEVRRQRCLRFFIVLCTSCVCVFFKRGALCFFFCMYSTACASSSF